MRHFKRCTMDVMMDRRLCSLYANYNLQHRNIFILFTQMLTHTRNVLLYVHDVVKLC